MDKWNEFSPCQNGGIAAYIHEHGTDSGCGDNNWPKTVGFLAGWGFGHATLNGKPLYDNYEVHFMVTQGLRDRKTLRVYYPMANKKLPAGETNPATQQIDFTSAVRNRIPRTARTGRCSYTSSVWRSPGSRLGTIRGMARLAGLDPRPPAWKSRRLPVRKPLEG